MVQNLGGLLDDARRRSFVGRREEIASFESALRATGLHRALFLHGPGGVGKTALLEQLRLRAEEEGRRVVHVDGTAENVDHEALAAAVAAGGRPPVALLVDGYEALTGLDGWFREVLLPSLPVDAVAVLAGREPPRMAWRSDLGWRSLLAVHRLDMLEDDDADELLARAGVPADRRRRLVEVGAGHPLALALLADAAARGPVPDHLAKAPDVVSALLPIVVGEAPDADHERGLEACVHAWLLTRDLLEEAIGERAGEVWSWLASRPFIVRSPRGLYPHELTRQLLEAELERRSPQGRRRMQRLVNRHANRLLVEASGAERIHHAMQLLWLHRATPVGQGLWSLRDGEGVSVTAGSLKDHTAVAGILAAEEGPRAARLAEAWLEVQPESLVVVRRDGDVAAFAVELILPAAPALENDDPVVRALNDEMARLAPLRAGERWSLGRFFGGRDGFQRGPLAVLAGSTSSCITWLTRPNAWSWIVTVDPEFWEPVFSYLALDHRLDIEVDGRRQVAFGMDWRRAGRDVWLEVMAERELTGDSGPLPVDRTRPPPLARDAFDRAVREALRALHRPPELRRSPLMGTRLASGPPDERVVRLQQQLRVAVDRVGDGGDGDELRRVLDRTFVRPAPSQEAAAEVLDMAFSTYRRRLARALDRVVDVLWAVEIGEVDLD
ncbi:MAG TPA: AAA family ATPase [Acidimicrobiales bacterium]|nr:AAA family ATPase [Acidimicrobiales bacterium]